MMNNLKMMSIWPHLKNPGNQPLKKIHQDPDLAQGNQEEDPATIPGKIEIRSNYDDDPIFNINQKPKTDPTILSINKPYK